MEERIEISENVKVEIDNHFVSVKSNGKEVRRRMYYPNVEISTEKNEIVVSSPLENRKVKRMINTYMSHVKNMIKGVTQGYIYKLKICFHHFPITVKVQGNEILIDNFMGERKPRKTKLVSNVDVKVDGNIITVTGIDKEAVGQTAANIERATKRSGYDKRVYQDGIYIIEKDGKSV